MTTASGHTSAIRAKKVIGTTVKNTAGQKIGQVEDIVLDKTSNNIIFAVVGFGGFLGMNEKFHPVPWSALDYDEVENSYVVPFTKEQLQAAPADSIDKLTRADGAASTPRAPTSTTTSAIEGGSAMKTRAAGSRPPFFVAAVLVEYRVRPGRHASMSLFRGA